MKSQPITTATLLHGRAYFYRLNPKSTSIWSGDDPVHHKYRCTSASKHRLQRVIAKRMAIGSMIPVPDFLGSFYTIPEYDNDKE